VADCLASVAVECAAFATGQVETLVVDNASSDDSVTHIATHFPWVQLIQNTTNVGFAAANNQAMALAKGKYILLLNSDTKVLSQTLTTMVEFMEAHPAVGASGARYLNPDGSLQPSCYPAPTLARELWRMLHLDRFYPYGIYQMNDWSMHKPRAVDIVQGAALLCAAWFSTRLASLILPILCIPKRWISANAFGEPAGRSFLCQQQ
jgi:GT2 family glycosyltransferase